jgi:hypothetical protein
MHVLYQSNLDQPASSLNLSVDLGGVSSRSSNPPFSSLFCVTGERVSRAANFSNSRPTPSAAFAIPILKSRMPFGISIDFGRDVEAVRFTDA